MAWEEYVYQLIRGPSDRGYQVGVTYYFPRISGGGGPNGHYWTVTRRDIRWTTKGWCHFAAMRPATDDEAARAADQD